jgi:hypothetical protein
LFPRSNERFCGVVGGPSVWPASGYTGKYDIGLVSDYGLEPGPKDCTVALSYFQEFFAHSGSIQPKVTGNGGYEYVYPSAKIECSVQEGGPMIQCWPKSKNDQPDTSVEVYRAYPR